MDGWNTLHTVIWVILKRTACYLNIWIVNLQNDWRMSCSFRHFTYVTAHSPTLPSLYLRHSSFSNSSIASPTSQLILQSFRFSYVTGSSLTSPGEQPMGWNWPDRNFLVVRKDGPQYYCQCWLHALCFVFWEKLLWHPPGEQFSEQQVLRDNFVQEEAGLIAINCWHSWRWTSIGAMRELE